MRRPTNLSKNYWYFFCSEISIITVNIAENPLQTVINPMKLYIFNPHRHGIFMVFRCSWVFQYSSYSRLKLKLYDWELRVTGFRNCFKYIDRICNFFPYWCTQMKLFPISARNSFKLLQNRQNVTRTSLNKDKSFTHILKLFIAHHLLACRVSVQENWFARQKFYSPDFFDYTW